MVPADDHRPAPLLTNPKPRLCPGVRALGAYTGTQTGLCEHLAAAAALVAALTPEGALVAFGPDGSELTRIETGVRYGELVTGPSSPQVLVFDRDNDRVVVVDTIDGGIEQFDVAPSSVITRPNPDVVTVMSNSYFDPRGLVVWRDTGEVIDLGAPDVTALFVELPQYVTGSPWAYTSDDGSMVALSDQ